MAILAKYYPAPNLNVAAGVLPNDAFTANTSTKADQVGVRVDHRFSNDDTVFFRYNRSNNNQTSPGGILAQPLPGYFNELSNYARAFAAGYTHLFGSNTILNLRYGYTQTTFSRFDDPAGVAFLNTLNFALAAPPKDGIPLGPNISISNGYTGVSQFAAPVGPQRNSDYHADLSKVVGKHTMYYRIHSFDDGWSYFLSFTPNGTSVDASQGGTGYGPASFLLGTPDSYSPWVGDTSEDQHINWYGIYAQDQWRATRKLVLTVGFRYDYISPPTFSKINSGLDPITGIFHVTAPVAPLFPKAVGPSSYYYPQRNGYQPRFGFVYQAATRTAIQGAFAIIDDHNNTLVEQQSDIRLSWPSGIATTISNQDDGLATTFINNLPPSGFFLDPNKPLASFGGTPDPKIPYSMEYNLGVEQQLTNSLLFSAHYVGSHGRHQSLQPTANTALTPGPGPISSRQPYPQYVGPFEFDYNEGDASYNALQLELKQRLASGLYLLTSYTYSKSLDIQSGAQQDTMSNFYNIRSDWGPSDYDRRQMFVLSTSYELPLGKGKKFMSDSGGIVQAILGNWNLGGIINADSGLPFNALAGGDVANVGGGLQRAEKIGDPLAGITQSRTHWVNPAAFAVPTAFTFGNEHRNDLVGPGYFNVDFDARKNFTFERFTLQFRSEFFNLFNRTQLGQPNTNVQSSAFGGITGTSAPGRERNPVRVEVAVLRVTGSLGRQGAPVSPMRAVLPQAHAKKGVVF